MQQAAAGNPLGTEKITHLMRRFSIPAIISFLVNAIYNIVDQIFIGWGIGTTGMAATNVPFPLTTICTALTLLLGIGCASNFSLCLGRGEREKASDVAGTALFLMAACGILLGVVSLLLLSPLLRAFGATDAMMPMSLEYTRIIAIGLPFAVLSTGACHLIRADGSPTYSMACMMAGAVFNLIFDPIFLFVFDMGIAGIALATTLGQVLSTAIALVYLVRRFKSVPLKAAHLRPRWDMTKMICALGAASCFNQLAMTAVQITMNNALRIYGAASVYGSEIPMACVGAIAKVNVVFLAFVLGMAQGGQPIIGYNYGARNYKRVKDTYRIALLFATGASCIAFLCFQLFPRQIMGIFGGGTEEYFRFATRYLRIYMMMTMINGIQPVSSNFFTAIGKAKIGMVVSLTRQIVLLLPLILLLPMWFGIDGIMYAGPVADFASAALSLLFVAREWRIITRLQREEDAARALLQNA